MRITKLIHKFEDNNKMFKDLRANVIFVNNLEE